MGSTFDDFAQMYEDMFALPWRQDLEVNSVLKVLGDLRGARVLDLGCGTGLYSRLLRKLGAAAVVGHDVSEGMIDHARARERADPQGVEYVTEAPADRSGTFDLVLGVYVLPYAECYEELVELCLIAARALTPGGRFVTLPVNPGYHRDRDYYARYGLRLYDAEPRYDASKVTLELAFGPYQERITARYWSRGTLEAALGEAGFRDVRWHGFSVSERGLRERPKEFWQPYLRVPHAALVSCVKGAERA